MKKDTLRYNDFNVCDFENKLDPENNFCNEFEKKCNYYTNVEFNSKIKINDDFSLIHFNCRSLRANAENINSYIESLDRKFDIIALTETWLNKEDDINEFTIEGYDIAFTNRSLRRGGGVMLYVAKHFDFNLVESMSVCIDDLVETVTVELSVKKDKNILISCIYRSPGGNLMNFNTFISDFIGKIGYKNFIMCGDFNINLMNSGSHKPTQEFIDTLLCSGIFSLIDIPTRVASNSSTLIDNIFTNIFTHSSNGVLIDDTVSDHLPIFSCMSLADNKHINRNSHKYVRCMSENNLLNFNSDLQNQDWSIVYDAGSANEAYENFIVEVQKLYEVHFPYKKITCKKNNKKPWMTKGLIKCCRRKNNLYKSFVTNKSIERERKYKQYKNKLTDIIRQSKKQYYNDILNKNSNNTKATWKILNDIINKKKVYLVIKTNLLIKMVRLLLTNQKLQMDLMIFLLMLGLIWLMELKIIQMLVFIII